MKIISWNVNGIRAVLKKGFMDFLEEYKPDILCIQETKAQPEQIEIPTDLYPHMYWNSADKKGYSGTGILSKIKPISITCGMGIDKHDHEGRIITAEFNNYYLVTVYTPNSKRDLSRLEYRKREWDVDFLKYIKTLESHKDVIFCGDLNVAYTEEDLANPQSNKTTKTRPGNAGFTDQERLGFANIIKAGFIDTFREFENGNGYYSWWSYMGNARARNVGWRIDYFCISPSIRTILNKSYILDNIMGSDHAPVVIEID